MGKTEMKMGKREIVRNGLCWSTGLMSNGIINSLFITYISFYATDVIGMSAAVIGLVLLVTKLFDGVTDLIAGFIIDNTHTKWGKGRPYEWCIPFAVLFTILLFSTPVMPQKMQAVWIGGMYVLVAAVFNTLRGASDPVYLLRAFPDEKNRNNVFSIAIAFSQIVGLTLGVILPILVAQAGTSHSGWTRLAIIGTVPFAVIGMIRFFTIKEVVTDDYVQKKGEETDKKQKSGVGIKDGFLAILKNRYILILTFGIFIIVVASGLLNTSLIYYFKYFVGDQSKMAIASMGFFAMLIMMVIYVPLSNKFGKVNVMKFSLLLAVAGCLIRWAGGTNIVTIFIGMAFMMAGIAPLSLFFPLFLFDIMDYSEWKTGKRVEGVLAVFPNFANKVAGGISVSFGAFILGAAGYDGKLAVQSEAAMKAIDLCFNAFPTILLAIMAALMFFFYDIDKVMPQVSKDLKERRGEK